MNKKNKLLLTTFLLVLLSFSLFAQPANDDPADAQAVGEVTDLAFDTSTATASGEGTCMTSPDVWYVFTAPGNGMMDVDLCGSTFDTKLAIFGGQVGALSQLFCNDDSCGLQSAIEDIPLTANTDYYIQVGGYSTNNGPGDLTIITDINADDDLQALSLVGPAESAVNVETTVTFSVYNRGQNTQNSYSVECRFQDGAVIGSENVTTAIAAGETATFDYSFTPTEAQSGTLVLEGEVTLEGDELELNNIISTSIYINSENDLEGVSIAGNATPTAGTATNYTIGVLNNGASQNSYSVLLKDDNDNILGSTTVNETIDTNEIVEISVSFTPTVAGEMIIHGEVNLDNDNIDENN
ncbi:MAG: CARDB domain-containing protein, partial [Candidatus Cloacimonadota bacterium]|nr:CARDB domain-containing protein [Candidatus Cloacimonadota bacterium]